MLLAFIDRWFADAVSDTLSYRYSVNYEIVSIVVAFPIYLLVWLVRPMFSMSLPSDSIAATLDA